jgi:tRNA-dihydrouridine synthase 3
MLARGALIKPWLFHEVKTGTTWLPTSEERLSVLWRFVELLREHFGTDERGRARTMRFLPWHLDFFCRYVPTPEEAYGEAAREHPLLQSRLQPPPPCSPVEALLADTRAETHLRIAEALLASGSRDEAHERAVRLAADLPPGGGPADLGIRASEIAG